MLQREKSLTPVTSTDNCNGTAGVAQPSYSRNSSSNIKCTDSLTEPSNLGEFSEQAALFLLVRSLRPLYWLGLTALVFILADAILFFPAQQSRVRVLCSIGLVVLVILVRKITYSRHTPIELASKLRLVPLGSAVVLACAFHLWNPELELARGLAIFPLFAAAQFRSLKSCVAFNLLCAIVWTYVWHQSGLPFTHTAILYHLFLIPIFSFAIFLCHDLALQEMFSLHRAQQQHSQEQQDAMLLVTEESTRRAEADAELRQANRSINEFLQRIPVACFRRTKDKILFMSSAYEHIWGRSVEELYENPDFFLDSVHPDDRNRFEEIFNKDLTNENCECEYRIIRPDGEVRWIEYETHPVCDASSEAEYGVGVAHDVTVRKEAEERFKQQESLLLHSSRLSSTGELVAGIAHEVNQPLYSILNYAKAIENTIDNESSTDFTSIRTWIRKIRDESTRGGKITQRLKSFVKRAESPRERTDLREIIRESIDFIAMEARHGVVEIVPSFCVDMPAVFVDRIQIQQVLVNLIKNAMEAFDEQDTTPRRIVISTQTLPLGIEVSVADNGVGLVADPEVNILDPFHTTKAEGIGLGLAISNTIIEAHHGELTYETNRWGGATFRFTLATRDCMEKV